MGKLGAVKKGEEKFFVVFQRVEKEITDGETKSILTLDFDQYVQRFNLKKDNLLLVSSCNIRDCLVRAEEKGVSFTDEEKKVSFMTTPPKGYIQ